jgi:predicted component of type VI protein secretion system
MEKLLALRVISRPDESDTSPMSAHFDAAGGLIGRADTARLILPDPKRMVSRFHAHVSHRDGLYFIEDMGSTNPATVNGQALATGQKLQLSSGDRIRIGHYTIAVDYEEQEFAPTHVTQRTVPGDFGGGGEEIEQHTRILVRAAAALPAGDRRSAPGSDELWSAFQEGAHVDVDLPNGLQPALMKTLGTMLRDSIGGLRRLLQVRRDAKKEVDNEVTQLRVRGINNPLKFAQDDARAVTNVLKPPIPGFMSGPDAIKDAVFDLESHIAATNSAMRAAAAQVLQRFDPEVLSAHLSKSGSMLGSLLPMARRAHLWDLYVQQNKAIRAEAENAFQEAYDRAFAAAYDAEVQRIRKEQGKRSW